MSAPATFHHVALSCRDPHVTERFYVKHFGFARARVIQAGDVEVVFLKSGLAYLELFKSEGDPPAPPAGQDGPHYPGIRHLAFKVDSVDAKLREIGSEAKVTLGPLAFDAVIPGWKTGWIADPDGRIVEISQGYVDQPTPQPLER